jgi:IS605 OrfB family transposase
VRIAGTPSRSRSTATAREWRTGSRCSPRSGALACTEVAQLRARQDRHDLQSGRRLLCGDLVCRCARAPAARSGAGDRHRHEPGVVATLANGQRIFTPGYYRNAEAYLRRCQRRVACRKKGSHRRRKAVALLAKAHQHIRNQRRDFHHRAAAKLVKAYDKIYYEDLRVRNMVQNHSLAKSISDAGWSAFLAILAFKAAGAGKRAVAVTPAFTSQACSGCGRIVAKGLSVRWHSCHDCGTSIYRDQNAARNILRLGQEHSTPGYGLRTPTWPVEASVVREPAGL